MGCLTAQKLDHVMGVMSWCIVLLEDKHIASNAAGHWQQFLHEQHVSLILPARYNENQVGITERPYGIAESGKKHSQNTAVADVLLFSCHLSVYTRSFCES